MPALRTDPPGGKQDREIRTIDYSITIEICSTAITGAPPIAQHYCIDPSAAYAKTAIAPQARYPNVQAVAIAFTTNSVRTNPSGRTPRCLSFCEWSSAVGATINNNAPCAIIKNVGTYHASCISRLRRSPQRNASGTPNTRHTDTRVCSTFQISEMLKDDEAVEMGVTSFMVHYGTVEHNTVHTRSTPTAARYTL